MTKHTLEFVSARDIVNHFAPQQNIEQYYNHWCGDWDRGNNVHSLVSSIEFLRVLRDFLAWLDIGVDAEKVEREYWGMLSKHTFIDLET
jgi:hypothetical protein